MTRDEADKAIDCALFWSRLAKAFPLASRWATKAIERQTAKLERYITEHEIDARAASMEAGVDPSLLDKWLGAEMAAGHSFVEACARFRELIEQIKETRTKARRGAA